MLFKNNLLLAKRLKNSRNKIILFMRLIYINFKLKLIINKIFSEKIMVENFLNN